MGADGTNTKFLGALLGGGSSGCNCGYNNNQNNINSCQCRNDLTFQDQYGNVHGACRRADETGRRGCYTTGYGCSDARQSQKFPNNPWSYQACGGSGMR